MATPVETARAAFVLADDLWHVELDQKFGKAAADMRYTIEGQGCEGSILNRLFQHRKQCQQRYFAALHVANKVEAA